MYIVSFLFLPIRPVTVATVFIFLLPLFFSIVFVQALITTVVFYTTVNTISLCHLFSTLGAFTSIYLVFFIKEHRFNKIHFNSSFNLSSTYTSSWWFNNSIMQSPFVIVYTSNSTSLSVL